MSLFAPTLKMTFDIKMKKGIIKIVVAVAFLVAAWILLVEIPASNNFKMNWPTDGEHLRDSLLNVPDDFKFENPWPMEEMEVANLCSHASRLAYLRAYGEITGLFGLILIGLGINDCLNKKKDSKAVEQQNAGD